MERLPSVLVSYSKLHDHLASITSVEMREMNSVMNAVFI